MSYTPSSLSLTDSPGPVPQLVIRPRPSTKQSMVKFDLQNVALVAGGVGVLYALYRLINKSSSRSSEPKGSHRSTNPYETPTLVHEYLMMHYHPLNQFIVHKDVVDMPKEALDFPSECARECVRWMKTLNQSSEALRVLDIGCAVGRSSFELARYAGSVIGLDFSHAFIDAANELKQNGSLPYRVKIEGDISEPAVATIDPSIDRSRCTFIQGDACALPQIEPVDCLLAANLVCRLPKPRKFLDQLKNTPLIKQNGFVVLFSPHTWLTDYTSKDEWLGGYYDASGNPIRTREALIEYLTIDGHFRLIHEANVPFFIRETERKNQWTISHLTVFQRL